MTSTSRPVSTITSTRPVRSVARRALPTVVIGDAAYAAGKSAGFRARRNKMTWVSAIEETPQEQASRQQAEQLGEPFLVYRGRGGRQTVFTLHRGKNRATIGRGPSNDIPLPWDTAVSRVHAELERV